MRKENPNGKLDTGHLVRVKSKFKGYSPPSEYEGLVLLLADVIDTCLAGTDCYATFGLSRSKDLIMLTVTHGGGKLYASGMTLEEVAANARLLL